MKPFLGIDLTTNKKNETPNGAEFLVAEPSAALADALEHTTDKTAQTINRAGLPKALWITQLACGAVGAVIALGIIKSLVGEDAVTISQAYGNAPWLFWFSGACLLACGILTLMGRKKSKDVLETEEFDRAVANLEAACSAVGEELGIPSDADMIDLLSFCYKDKDGEVKVVEKTMQIAQYNTAIFSAFTDADTLYLANMEGKYAFPLSSLVSLRIVKKHITMDEWNKDECYDEGIYKPYKLVEDNYDRIHCKSCGILEIDRAGEVWGIYVPPYEVPVLERLTGLTAQTES